MAQTAEPGIGGTLENIHQPEPILARRAIGEPAHSARRVVPDTLIINERGILVYFDDQPEMLTNVTALTGVMLVRNEGNYDFDDKKWIFSERTCRLL